MRFRIFGWTIAIYRAQVWTKPKGVKIIWAGECRGGRGGYNG